MCRPHLVKSFVRHQPRVRIRVNGGRNDAEIQVQERIEQIFPLVQGIFGDHRLDRGIRTADGDRLEAIRGGIPDEHSDNGSRNCVIRFFQHFFCDYVTHVSSSFRLLGFSEAAFCCRIGQDVTLLLGAKSLMPTHLIEGLSGILGKLAEHSRRTIAIFGVWAGHTSPAFAKR